MDAKAWQPEEALQTLLTQCVANQPVLPTSSSVVAPTSNVTEEIGIQSTAISVVSAPVEVVSQYSTQSTASTVVQRRHVFAALRHNLMQIMVTMDEKNHVINNANDELSRHIRRLDNVWPHIADEISEEARLGSLKHWAYTETNPTKKAAAASSSRREAAANLALLHDNDAAQRSESRREAVAAKSKSRLAHMDSAFDEVRPPTKKTAAETKRRAAEGAGEATGLGISATGVGKGKKTAKVGSTMDKSLGAAIGGRIMSREPSQQENIRKRKAPAPSAVARKRYALHSMFWSAANGNDRLNANQDSPKLTSSPLASNFGTDAYKRSPALAAVRPVLGRARQNSAQGTMRPASSASQTRDNVGVSASTPELKSVAAATGKTANEVKHTMRETINNRGERLIEDDDNAGLRGGLVLDRQISRQTTLRDEDAMPQRRASPRPPMISTTTGKGRASKTSTPIVGSFVESDAYDSFNNENGNGKSKRNARVRTKDLAALHDSLSPRDLPSKRSHKKGASQGQPIQARLKEELENTTPSNVADEDDEEDDIGADNERYCYCNGVSYGEMVACDNPKCPREWFHLECIGLKTVPKSAQWWCEDCLRAKEKEKEKTKKKVNGNGHGNGGGR